jgi:hypothetical protein
LVSWQANGGGRRHDPDVKNAAGAIAPTAFHYVCRKPDAMPSRHPIDADFARIG